jgi:hypothetical protein
VLTYVAINHAKFGTYVQPAPMSMHEQMAVDPTRLIRTGGNWMWPGNIPTTANAYFSLTSISFGRQFPWVFLQEHLRLLPGQRIDGWGAFSSVTTAMPAFVLLGLMGLRKSNAIILIGSLAPVAAILAFSSVDNRYLHELFPLLMITSAAGMSRVMALKKRGLKRTLIVILLLNGLWQLYANGAFALVYQRLLVFDAPLGPQLQLRQWQRAIDGTPTSAIQGHPATFLSPVV